MYNLKAVITLATIHVYIRTGYVRWTVPPCHEQILTSAGRDCHAAVFYTSLRLDYPVSPGVM